MAETAATIVEKHIRELLDSSYQGVKRSFVLAYDNTAGDDQVSVSSFKNFSFLELKLKITTSKLMEEIFIISQLMSWSVRKISTGQGDDYIAGCLLDFAYFEKNYRVIAADLSKKKKI